MRFGVGALVFALFAVQPARAEPITWVTSTHTVPQSSETQDSAQLSFLIAHLPSFTHHVVRVSTARAYHELEHGPGVCKVGVLITAERQRYAAFAARHMVLSGYHLVVRKDRMAALAPAIVKGEVDLDKLADVGGVTGGYTHLRHYDAVITDFVEAHDGTGISNVVATVLLFNMMQAERLDYAFLLPLDVYFYSDEAARQNLVLLPIKGALPWVEAGVACSSDPLGKNVIRAIDGLLADNGRWAEFVDPLRRWVSPEDYSILLAGRFSNGDRMP